MASMGFFSHYWSGPLPYVRCHVTVNEMLSVSLYKIFPSCMDRRKEGRKEGNVLFNDALITFYLWIYKIGHVVKDHSERGNLLPPLHGLLFLICRKGYFICTTHRIVHTTAFDTPGVEHWLEKEIDQWVYYEGSIQRPITP